MTILVSEELPLNSAEDIVMVRQKTRTFAVRRGLGLTNQTKIVTAASELARNTVIYGGGGTALIEEVESEGRVGVRVTFEDHGPGIANLDLAMTSGYTSGGGMGLGLPGSRRLVDEFDIWTEPGKGTRISVIRWK